MNREMALRRLKALRTRLVKQTALKEKYVQTIERYLSEGYASPIPSPDNQTSPVVWHLPRHLVIHPRKRDKIRIVFD